jgi:hypothetical protein
MKLHPTSASHLSGLTATFLLSLALTGISSTSAYAAKHVISPIVERGEIEFESKLDGTMDDNPALDNAQSANVSVGYGVTSYWYTELELQWKKDAQSDYHFDSTSWENRFQLTPQGQYWLDLGMFLEYEKVSQAGDHDNYTVGLLGQKEVGETLTTGNLLLTRELGDGGAPGVATELRMQTIWRNSIRFQPGLEVYYEPGQWGNFNPSESRRLRAGPVMVGQVNAGSLSKIKYELGYLFGMNPASERGTVRARVEYEFR